MSNNGSLLIRRLFLYSFLLLNCIWYQAFANKKEFKTDKVMCVTIPKTGTHLLLKCLSLFEVDGISYKYWKKPMGHFVHDLRAPISIALKEAFRSDNQLVSSHLLHNPEAEKFIADHTKAYFFMIRDPRAQLVSQAKSFKSARIGLQKRSLEEVMLDIILARKEFFAPRPKHLKVDYKNLPEHIVLTISDLFWSLGLREFYKNFIPWMQAQKCCTIRFENLVGADGGGTSEKQFEEIKKIAQHLNITLSDEKILKVQENLFGGTGTFREGQIDSWRKYFTPRVEEEFKKDAGLMQLLIDLGYENDTKW